MKKKSIWLLIGLLVATLVCAIAGCKKSDEPTGPEEPAYAISETSVSLKVGEEKQLTITPAPEAAVSWETANASVATVANGLVSAVGAGSATVSAKIEGVEAALTCTVTVTEQLDVDGYSLDFSSASLKTGETLQIHVLNEDGDAAESVTYSSKDPAIATVSESGLITAVAAGEADIWAKLEGGTLVCKVTVAQSYVYSLDQTTLDLAVGASGKLTLMTTPGGSATNRPHTFSSSDTDIVTVSGGTGKLTGVSKGTATITCLVDGTELTATVNVIEYTVKIDGEALTEETTLLLGEEYDIEIEADPAREISATYASSNEDVLTVTNGRIVPNRTGTATVTITVGGKTFQTKVTVESDYKINETEYSLYLGATDGGNTVQLAVESKSGAASPSATFESSDTSVATVDADGTVTAIGIGTATITTTVSAEIVFETTITVVPATSLAHTDYTFGSGAVNLTYLGENKTIDWRRYNDGDGGALRMNNNANLIGDHIAGGGEKFWDYKAPVIYDDTDTARTAFTYGYAVHGSYTVPVKVTNAVTKVVILTGAWKEAATIEFKLGDTVLQSDEFAGGEDALARKYELTINTAELKAGEELDLTIAVNCNREHGGNVPLAAVAVVGNEAHEHAPTATSTGNVTTGLTGAQNLSTAGTLDWLSATDARKAGVPENSIIDASGIQYHPGKRSESNYPGATVTWTDGTESAPANNRKFYYADNCIEIPVLLYKGESTVTIFATGWTAGYLAAAYDQYGNFVGGYQGADESGGSVSSKIVFNMNVEETGVFTFKIMKCRGGGNCGWAGIAVSSTSDIKPTTLQYNLVKGGNNEATIALTNAPADLTYTSGDTSIATVDASGKITAVDKGNTYITISDGTTERRVFVTVVEYTLTSSNDITLSIGATSQIEITADPDTEFTASYSSSNEDTVTVDTDGVIHAVKSGTVTITVTVGGKSFTIAVKVEGYQINYTEYTLNAGEDSENRTVTLKLYSEDDLDTPLTGVHFQSQNANIADVDETTGEVTALTFGSTVIEAHIGSVVLYCTITVEIDVDVTAIDYADGTSPTVNLDELDDTNATLDWHFFRNGTVHEMNGGSLIGNLKNERLATFGDYRAHMTWYNGATEGAGVFGYTDGWTFKNGVSFDVTVTSDVKYIAIFTGAWHAKNTITISYGDKVYATFEFSNNEVDGYSGADKNKQIIFTPDTAHLGTENKTFTITITTGTNLNGWSDNISLVAIAVVGKTARTSYTPVTVTESQVTSTLTSGGDAVNLTTVGTLDWMYICDGSGTGMVKKDGVSNVIYSVGAIGGQGAGNDHFANQSFTWTDGTNETSGTDLFKWCDNKQAISVRLTQSAKVTLWISAWKSSLNVSVYDRTTEVLPATSVLNGNGSSSQGVMVEITLNVTTETVFTFCINRVGDGNFGLGAIAVANI